MAAMHHLIGRSHTHRSGAITLTIAALAGLSSLLAGCGGASGPGVAHLSSGEGSGSTRPEGAGSQPESRAGAEQKLVAYARCMRANGVPDFPEPVDGAIALHAGPGGLNRRSPQFQAAERACRPYFGPPGSKGGPVAATPPGGEASTPTGGPGGGEKGASVALAP